MNILIVEDNDIQLQSLFENKEDAFYEYHQCIEKLHHIYDKYESHERFLKSRHLHIRHCFK